MLKKINDSKKCYKEIIGSNTIRKKERITDYNFPLNNKGQKISIKGNNYSKTTIQQPDGIYEKIEVL